LQDEPEASASVVKSDESIAATLYKHQMTPSLVRVINMPLLNAMTGVPPIFKAKSFKDGSGWYVEVAAPLPLCTASTPFTSASTTCRWFQSPMHYVVRYRPQISWPQFITGFQQACIALRRRVVLT